MSLAWYQKYIQTFDSLKSKVKKNPKVKLDKSFPANFGRSKKKSLGGVQGKGEDVTLVSISAAVDHSISQALISLLHYVTEEEK